ncbi:MAG: hypothetical protein KDC26_02405 [Armatimonadetes bacterium]|nr:hypothetical protein [Armatimonadota bacterium]
MAVLPQEMVTQIGRAYLQGQDWLRSQGKEDAESIEVALAVESSRWFWRPSQTKTLILLPARELTLQEELSHVVKVGWLKDGENTPPNSFTRSFYSIGHGEPEIVPTLPKEQNKDSNREWHVMAELVGLDDLTPKRTLVERLEWKARILKGIKNRGIWVAEASLHGDHDESDLYGIAWRSHWQSLWEELDKPEIIAYGKGLYESLERQGIPVSTFLYEPQTLRQDSQKQHQSEILHRIFKLTTATGP